MSRSNRMSIVACAIAVLACFTAAAQAPTTVTISTNPMKYFIGLPNVDVEVIFGERVGVHLAAEYLFGGLENHPRAVVRLGARYYPLTYTEVLPGTFTSVDVAWVSRDEPEASEAALVGELGYRLAWGWFALVPKGVVSYGFTSTQLLPGAELLTGWTYSVDLQR